MPTVRILTPPTQEPVSLALLVAQVRLDADGVALAAYEAKTLADAALVGQLDLLALYGQAAREKVEAYTGRYFAPQTLELTYELGEPYVLPSGATAASVSGFFTTLADLADAAAYLEEYRKGISINRQLPWAEALQQTYTVTASVVADPQFSGLAKRAVLELAAEWYRNRETTADARGLTELPAAWRVALAEARVSVLGESWA